MTTTRTTTATDLMAAIAAAGLHVRWDRTGGNCRAIRVQTRPGATDPHVLITHECEPFSDGDLHDDLRGQHLALCLYDREDGDPTVHVDAVSDSRRIAEVVAGLLATVRLAG
ncbi:hypothetical protein ACFY2Y_15635 [Janibacter hoylei]|uniref:hypothetical protein n=1 Tax=Janibacter hoylei TaxID=364298 RepID=UPI0036B2C5DC